MMKKTLLLLVLLLLSLAFTVAYADASDFDYEVISEEDKTCMITGYTGNDAVIVIPEQLDGYSVVKIDNYAFWYEHSLVDVTIPDFITWIGYRAFSDCDNLRSVTLPSKMPNYGLSDHVFWNCTSLESIVLPDGLLEVQESTFENCQSLQSVVLPETLHSIGESAFKGCKKLSSPLTLPHQVDDYAFSGCVKLTEVHFISKAESNYMPIIDEYAFEGCSSLSIVSFDDGLYDLYDAPFSGMQSLTSVTFGKGEYWLCDNSFAGCTGLTNFVLPENIAKIPAGMFDGCTSLQSILIPDSVTEIGENAFRNVGLETLSLRAEFADMLYGCGFGNKLKHLTITGEMEAFDAGMLSGLTDLRTLRIPESVTSIYQSAEMDMPYALESMNLPRGLEMIECWWLMEQFATAVLDVYPESEGYRFATEYGFDYRLCSQSFTSIAVPAPLSLYPGQNGELQIETVPAVDDLSKFIVPQLLFSSNKPEIATVDENGFITAHGIGTAIITIQDKDDPFVYAQAEVNVVSEDTQKPLAFISISGYSVGDSSADDDISDLTVKFGVDGMYPPYDITFSASGHTTQYLKKTATDQTQFTFYLPRATSSDDYTFHYDIDVTVTDANGFSDTAHGEYTQRRTVVYDPGGYRVNPSTGQVTYYGPSEKEHWYEPTIVQDNGFRIALLSIPVDQLLLRVGENTQVPYSAKTAYGDLSHDVYFVSSDPSIVRVERDGSITAVSSGVAEVTVRAADGSGLFDTVQVICAVCFVDEISLEAGPVDRETLQQQLSVTILPEEAADISLEWSSSDESIASVDEHGVATWYTAGTVTFTVTALDGTGKSASCEYQWDGIQVEKLELFLKPNGQQIGWRVEPANATNPMITFRVSKPTLVEINEAGYLHFLEDCEVTVRGTTVDGSNISADLTVSGTAAHPHLPFSGKINMQPATNSAQGSIPALRCVVCKETVYASHVIAPELVLYLPGDVLEIGAEAFAGSAAFQQIVIPDTVTAIPSRAFANCRNPLVICIPDSVTSIAEDAFEGVSFVILVCEEGSFAQEYALEQELLYHTR